MTYRPLAHTLPAVGGREPAIGGDKTLVRSGSDGIDFGTMALRQIVLGPGGFCAARAKSCRATTMDYLTLWRMQGNRLLVIIAAGIRWEYDDRSTALGRWICASRS